MCREDMLKKGAEGGEIVVCAGKNGKKYAFASQRKLEKALKRIFLN